MPIKVEEYLREDASSPYQRWFESLPAQAAAKVAVAKLRMELGNTSSIKWFEGMGEYVIDWGPGYRIYLAKDGETLIICLAVEPSVGSSETSIRPRFCWPSTKLAKSKKGEHGTD